MSSLSTLPKGDSAWLLRKSIQRIIQQVSVLETNIGSSTTGNSANTQVIFNDNGVLRGDAGLTYNAATDLLSVGSATITGDLTVDTSTLKVDSANDRVGIGTATPANTLEVVAPAGDNIVSTFRSGDATAANNAGGGFRSISSATAASRVAQVWLDADGANFSGGDYFFIQKNGGSGTVEFNQSSNAAMVFLTNSTERYRIASDGVATWSNVGGVAGTAMTLNATGLGVGASPTSKLTIGTGAYAAGTLSGTSSLYSTVAQGLCVLADGFNIATRAGADRFTLDSAGQVGIGVTPSAWDTNYKALQLGYPNFISGNNGGNIIDIGVNAYFNTDWKYAASSVAATRYRQVVGVHQWFTAPSGTAGNNITWTQAMTLDASGNLVVGDVSTGNRRLEVKSAGTSNTTFAAHFRDSADTLLFHVRSDGYFNSGQGALSPYNNITASAANIFVDSSGFLYRSTSSLKYKTDVKDSVHGLADVLKLRPVTYKSKNGDDTVFGGLIAEEVHAAGLTEFVAYAPDNTPDAIHYSNMVSLLVAAIQELTARVQTLEAK